MKAKHLIFVCPILLSLACNQKKQFSAPVESKKTPVKEAEAIKEESVVASPKSPEKEVTEIPKEEVEVPVQTPPKCEVGESEVTQVKLLTEGVDFSKENQLVKYELQILSCKDGTAVPLNDQAIMFDLDMQYYNSGLESIAYRVLEATLSSQLVAGDFKTVSGSDLFGNTGNGYRHWKTENVNFSSKVEKVILEINLKKAKLKTAKENEKTADSYLRIGKAAPVTARINVLGQ